jgi:RND family efflux transporter MFP subunit
MPDPETLLPAAPERPLLDQPDAEKLRLEVESLRHQLEQERNKNRSKDKNKQAPQRPRKRTLWLLGLALLVLLIAAFFLGFLPHERREKQLRQDAQAEAKALPILSYIYAQRSSEKAVLTLPGNIEALTEAPVLARATGYLKKRYADIGDRVKAGQLLAEIAAPDLDQQVEQARAQLQQARASLRQSLAALEQGRANQRLSKVTADRWAALLKRGAVAPQDNDSKQADYQAQTANIAALEEAAAAAQQNASAAEANLNRLIELQGYEQVIAPFSGVITLRNIDAGTLITTGQTLLFRIAQTDRLRTYLYVPESNAPLVQVGQRAALSVEAFPGRQFPGIITRTSDALDPGTRTLLTEVQVINPGNNLSPGMFSEVTLNQLRPHPPILIPSDALIVRPNGLFVAVLQGNAPDQDTQQGSGQQGRSQQQGQDQLKGGEKGGSSQDQQKGEEKGGEKDKNDRQDKAALERQQQQLPTFTVHLAPVTVGRDYGNATEILTGLSGGERVIQNPNDQVEEKAQVKGEQSKQNPVTEAPGQGGTKQAPNANSEQLAPKPNAEPAPKQPSKERMNRGPGK